MAEENVPQSDQRVEPQAGSDIQNKAKKPVSISLAIAALLYYEANGVKKSFETLPDKEQDPYLQQTAKLYLCLDKLDLQLTKKIDIKKVELSEQETFNRLAAIIRDFVKKLKHPKNVAQFFPVDELAMVILKGEK